MAQRCLLVCLGLVGPGLDLDKTTTAVCSAPVLNYSQLGSFQEEKKILIHIIAEKKSIYSKTLFRLRLR